jgi:hypothetical protein
MQASLEEQYHHRNLSYPTHMIRHCGESIKNHWTTDHACYNFAHQHGPRGEEVHYQAHPFCYSCDANGSTAKVKNKSQADKMSGSSTG